ncbi:hypothetical protein Q0F98_19735 [Paenibacillus amylolyticus]|nr:hypothetical protein Q0F98_19735 [Paenibacillus amylolyticus]
MDERWIEMLRSFVLACYEGIFIYLVLAILTCSVLVVAALHIDPEKGSGPAAISRDVG